jgi:predicted nucleic acid-binding protein
VRYVLDTNVVLYALSGNLADPLPEGRYFASVISALELLSYPPLEPEEERQIREFLSTVTVVELQDAVKSAAIQLRRKHRLKLADAIIAGTALTLGGTLITNDRRLSHITDIAIQPVRQSER